MSVASHWRLRGVARVAGRLRRSRAAREPTASPAFAERDVAAGLERRAERISSRGRKRG